MELPNTRKPSPSPPLDLLHHIFQLFLFVFARRAAAGDWVQRCRSGPPSTAEPGPPGSPGPWAAGLPWPLSASGPGPAARWLPGGPRPVLLSALPAEHVPHDPRGTHAAPQQVRRKHFHMFSVYHGRWWLLLLHSVKESVVRSRIQQSRLTSRSAVVVPAWFPEKPYLSSHAFSISRALSLS